MSDFERLRKLAGLNEAQAPASNNADYMAALNSRYKNTGNTMSQDELDRKKADPAIRRPFYGTIRDLDKEHRAMAPYGERSRAIGRIDDPKPSDERQAQHDEIKARAKKILAARGINESLIESIFNPDEYYDPTAIDFVGGELDGDMDSLVDDGDIDMLPSVGDDIDEPELDETDFDDHAGFAGSMDDPHNISRLAGLPPSVLDIDADSGDYGTWDEELPPGVAGMGEIDEIEAPMSWNYEKPKSAPELTWDFPKPETALTRAADYDELSDAPISRDHDVHTTPENGRKALRKYAMSVLRQHGINPNIFMESIVGDDPEDDGYSQNNENNPFEPNTPQWHAWNEKHGLSENDK